MSYTIGVVCDIGAGPASGGRQRNEDNFLVCIDDQVVYDAGGTRTTVKQRGKGVLIAVCDGMGGHADGHIASMTAVKVLARLYQPDPPKNPERVLLRYILDTHTQLHRAALADGGGPAAAELQATYGASLIPPKSTLMGTTLTVAWILDGVATWAHVGDSRLYHCRDGRLTRLTADHTRNEFARRDGKPERPDAETLAQNYIYGSRGLQDDALLRLDPGLDTGRVELWTGDRLLLCTDGATASLTDAHLASILRDSTDPLKATEQIRNLAIEAGSLDNITAVVLNAEEPSSVTVVPDDWLDEDDVDTEMKANPLKR
jgi:PPM family protein phosphatase